MTAKFEIPHCELNCLCHTWEITRAKKYFGGSGGKSPGGAAGGGAAGAAGGEPVGAPSAAVVSEAAAAEVAELEARLAKMSGELQAARQERKEGEQLKMASEQIVLDLRQEKLRLEEAALTAEEQVRRAESAERRAAALPRARRPHTPPRAPCARGTPLTSRRTRARVPPQVLSANEESDAKQLEAMEAKEAQMKAEIKAEQLMQRLASTDDRAHGLQVKLDGLEAKYKESHDEVVALEEEK